MTSDAGFPAFSLHSFLPLNWRSLGLVSVSPESHQSSDNCMWSSNLHVIHNTYASHSQRSFSKNYRSPVHQNKFFFIPLLYQYVMRRSRLVVTPQFHCVGHPGYRLHCATVILGIRESKLTCREKIIKRQEGGRQRHPNHEEIMIQDQRAKAAATWAMVRRVKNGFIDTWLVVETREIITW